jgi:hypothetical protein
LEWATLTVAVLALVLSVISVGWQVWTWRGSGPRVKVTANQAVILPVGSDPYVSVTAANTGRSATTVAMWGFDGPNDEDGQMLFPYPTPWSTPLPHRLDAHSNGTWYVQTAEVRQGCAEHGWDYRQIRGWVRLSSGEKVYAERRGIGLL